MWLAVFHDFITYNVEDSKFIDFLKAYKSGLNEKEIDGVSMKDFKDMQTKKKATIVGKIELLIKLMKDYLHIEDSEQITPLDFVKENVNPDITADDIADYEQFYEDDIKIEVDNSSKLLDDNNVNSMLALIAYVMNSNIKINVFKEWLVNFFEENNTYNVDQKSNYIFMRDSLQRMAVA